MDYREDRRQRRECALKGRGSTGGFSMAETLATVAIIVILLALAVVGIFNLYYSLQQKELDSKAEIIYVAAQDQMTKIMAAGRSGLMEPGDQTGAVKINDVPGDATNIEPDDTQGDANTNYVEKGSIAYLTSKQLTNDASAASVLFGEGGLDDELLQENWVVEYDYRSLAVYAVFFNPDDPDFVDGYVSEAQNGEDRGGYNSYRDLGSRLEALKSHTKRIGYHGGAGSAASGESHNLSLRVNIENNEKLIANITCDKPVAVTENVAFRVDVKDDRGNVFRTYYTLGSTLSSSGGNKVVFGRASSENETDKIYNSGYRYSLKLTLDSLEAGGGKRFTKLYGSDHVEADGTAKYKQKLVEGSNITVDVVAFCPDDNTVQWANVSDTDNSLFAENTTGDTAHIAYGRHLQNLDVDSGVNNAASTITKAVQDKDIDFTQNGSSTAEGYEDWYKTYGGEDNSYYHGQNSAGVPLFEPVSNSRLTSYDGQSKEIKRLYVETKGSATSGAAGLFDSLKADKSLTLCNIKLASPHVKCIASASTGAKGNAGALLAQSSGDLSIENCQVYLEADDQKPNTQTQSWLQGVNTGGLVGNISGGTASIKSSSASTVIGDTSDNGPSSTTTVGGLVGSVDAGTVTIARSYADSYLMGRVVGGLVGSAGDSASLDVDSSYAAGFIAWGDGGSGAGVLANGSARSVSNTYTVIDRLLDTQAAGYKSPGSYAPIARGGSFGNCLYLKPSSGSTASAGAGVTAVDDNTDGVNAMKGALATGDDSAFAMDASSTPYNLMNQGLIPDSYAWPKIKDLPHYGDWVAGFKPGSLVYYEKYLGGSYGFDGANVTKTLRDDAKDNAKKRFSVVGDGYGVVYKEGEVPSAEVTVEVKKPDGSSAGTYTFDPAKAESYPVENGGDRYVIYPLPAKITNVSKGAGKSFFFTATINVAGGSPTIFFFNPHFARTVRGPVSSTADTPALGTTAYLRSARQLYNLSRFYDDYREVAEGRTFSQERNIDYAEYEWAFADENHDVKSQQPIGESTAQSFTGNYNGNHHEITNVSFVTRDGMHCAGLFGSVSASSSIQNVILCTDYSPSEQNKDKKYYVKCAGTISGNVNAYLGVLAGYNAGTINNCSVSGYYIADSTGTIHAYTNSRVHVGGLVGANKGKIYDSSADSPRLRLSALFSDVNAAGFVGTNLSGAKIDNCYALGAVELTDAKGGNVNIAGFAGKNSGRITSSYAATSISVSGEGAQSYGFAPKGGYVSSNCRYLNNGTYSYIQRMYSYNFRTALSSGTPISYEALKKTSSKGKVDADHTFYYDNTDSDSKAYPYRGVVKDAQGDYIHYGDWQDDVRLGTLGVYYWEHEENGSNNGYHLTYLGTKADYDKGKLTDTLEQGTSLCTAHDDNGVITSYGYGFYIQTGENVSASWDGIASSAGDVDDVSKVTNYNKVASSNLQEQLSQSGVVDDSYAFYAFTTRTKDQASGGDYITLDRKSSSGGKINDEAQNGYLTLALTSGSGGTSKKVCSYKFEISPFFANAMSINSVDGSADAALVEKARQTPLEASDGMLSNYAEKPGKSETTVASGNQTAGNAYEIRSLDQLQYINWNGSEKSTGKLATTSNYTQFNYLMFPDQTGVANDNQKGSVDKVASESKERAKLFWTQTHDVAPVADDANFTPIAGTYESSSGKNNANGGYNASVYLWFGGTYNGQSYTVKDIDISSNSFNVGLFGTTVGANISNVIMYSDDPKHAIVRQEQGEDEYPDKEGAYSIGGLVGVAFDYVVDANALKGSSNAIYNCAISGYSVIDKSSNQMGLGEVNVGGLIGVANVNLRQCSSSVTILEQATFAKGVAQFGAFIRVGGLCGGAQGNVIDCYTGGSFDFASNIANTVNWNNNRTDNDKHDFFIGVGGIAGSAFTSNYVNLTGQNTVRDGSPVFKNCYTYFTFPDHGIDKPSGGSEPMLVMSTIASRADRGGIDSGQLKVDNCYYYDQIPTVTTENGTIAAGKVAVQYRGSKTNRTEGAPTAISYDAMSSQDFIAKLNVGGSTGWDHVTTTDAGGEIDGKFSFPSANAALEGKNYPFPAIVTQNDLTFGTVSSPSTVHVHYGDWPITDASYWELGRGQIDIFADRGDAASLARKTFKLHVNSKDFSGALTATSFKFADSGIVRIADGGVFGGANGVYDITIEALQEGSTVVTLGDTSASISLQVTANLDLSASLASGSPGELRSNPDTLVLENDPKSPATLDLHAKSGTKDCNGMLGGTNLAPWSWTNDDAEHQTYVSVEFDQADASKAVVTRSGSGTALLAIDANYLYNGLQYSKQLYINVVEPGVLGLADGTHFNEVRNTGKHQEGIDNDYTGADDAPSYTLGSDESFYLYSASDDSYLDNAANIKQVRIGSGTGAVTCVPGDYVLGSNYYVSLADKTVASGSYKYLPVTVSYLGDKKSKPSGDAKVKITVTLASGSTTSTLSGELSPAALKETGMSTLTFESDATSASKQVKLPNGYKYVFESADKILGAGSTSRDFDEWQRASDDEFFAAGDKITVKSDMTFKATYKRVLTFAMKDGSSLLSQSVQVGRKGASAEEVQATVDEWKKSGAVSSLLNSYRLDGFYDGTSSSSKKVVGSDGSLVDDGTFANGVLIERGILKIAADTTLHAAKATWSPANSIEDGQDYLIANSNTTSRGAKLSLAATGKVETGNAIKSGFAAAAVTEAPIYKLSSSSATTDNSSSSKVSARVDDGVVWHAVEQPKLSGYATVSYFSIQNAETGLYLLDVGASSGGVWYIGGIADIYDCGGLKIDSTWYDNWRRCSFMLNSSDKTLRTFNKPGTNYNVNFNAATDAVLCANSGGGTRTYLYAKNLEFDW